MRASLFFCLFFLLFLLLGCANYDQVFEEIIRLEDRRAPAPAFAKFLSPSNTTIQRRAVIALGRLQDPEAVPLLTPLLEKSNAATRAEVAFALGQLGQSQSTNLLLQQLSEEKDLEVRLALIEAASKSANDSSLAAVSAAVTSWLNDQIPIVRAEAALAAGRLAQRGFKIMEWSASLARLLGDADEEVRWRAAYALFRLHSGNQTATDSVAEGHLIKALHDHSARVRMQAARALGAMKTALALEPLTTLAQKDNDWRVRVNATTALGSFDFAEVTTRLALHDTSEHVRLAAMRSIGAVAERMARQGTLKDSQLLAKFLQGQLHRSQSTWRERAAAALALAQVFQKEAVSSLASLAKDPHPIFRSRIAEVLGVTAAAEAFPHLEKMAHDSATIVQIAALEALPKLPAAVQKKVTPIYLEALQCADAVLAAIAAQNLAADSLQCRNHAAAIIAAYQRLKQSVDVETAQMIFAALATCGDSSAKSLLEEAVQFPDKPFARAAAEALKKLTGEDYSSRIPKENQTQLKFTYKEILELAKARATIQTNKGIIELEFFTEAAPLTTLNFVRLTQKNFFEGRLIHRVVPNFVIQTGDPRGDGWGSPGYTTRSEFSRLRYTRGMVGMASVGPDTEGCQFFITHSEQPHLDGRYTIFARVTNGMATVDTLQAGDRMEKVTIQF